MQKWKRQHFRWVSLGWFYYSIRAMHCCGALFAKNFFYLTIDSPFVRFNISFFLFFCCFYTKLEVNICLVRHVMMYDLTFQIMLVLPQGFIITSILFMILCQCFLFVKCIFFYLKDTVYNTFGFVKFWFRFKYVLPNRVGKCQTNCYIYVSVSLFK